MSDNSENDVVVSSKSRFKGDTANKEKATKHVKMILPVTIGKFPLDLYNRMVAFRKKHGMVDSFSDFCLNLLNEAFYTEESLDIAEDTRKQKATEATPDGT